MFCNMLNICKLKTYIKNNVEFVYIIVIIKKNLSIQNIVCVLKQNCNEKFYIYIYIIQYVINIFI